VSEDGAENNDGNWAVEVVGEAAVDSELAAGAGAAADASVVDGGVDGVDSGGEGVEAVG